MDTIGILVVDDHATVREHIKLLLGSHPEFSVVGEAGDGEEAIAKARELAPDVVLMDIKMPRLDGLSATCQLKQEMPGLCVVITTLYDEREYRSAASASGADGFIAKNAVIRDLAPVIWKAMHDRLSAGSCALPPPVTRGRWGAKL